MNTHEKINDVEFSANDIPEPKARLTQGCG